MYKYVLDIGDPESWVFPSVGGKAHAIGQMIKAGITVPPAFCVTVDTYKAFARQPEANSPIQAALEDLRTRSDVVNIDVLEEILNPLRSKLLHVPIPEPIRDEVSAAYMRLGALVGEEMLPVAVRSSATAEDLPQASFAGQYDSFLLVRGENAVLESVRRCWVSLWSTRAVMYRLRLGLEHERVFMAVVVQKMVNANTSGVVFTVNPQNNASQIVINAIRGLGEPLVSGDITPDTWVIDKMDGSILEAKLAQKRLTRISKEEGAVVVNTPQDKWSQPSLTSKQLMEVRDVALRLEEYFRHPQDIEWSYDREELYVLQSRPITTVKPSDELQPENRFHMSKGYWTRLGIGEWLQRPLSPLFSSFIVPRLESSIDVLLKERLGIQRAYPGWKTVNGYYYIHGAIAPSLSWISAPVQFLRHLRPCLNEWHQNIVPYHLQQIERIHQFDPAKANANKILDHFDQVCEISRTFYAWLILTGAYARFTETIFRCLHRLFLKDAQWDYTALLGGYPNKSVEADQALWELAEIGRNQQAVKAILCQDNLRQCLQSLASDSCARDWFALFRAWLDNYGSSVFDLDIMYATVQDNPAIALALVRSFVKHERESPEARQRKQKEIRGRATDDFERVLRRRPLLNKLLRRSLAVAQGYAAIRESRPFYLHLGWPLMRRDALELGRRLAERHVLVNTNDIFFLTSDELRTLVIKLDTNKGTDLTEEIKSSVRHRKGLMETRKALKPPEHINPNIIIRLLLRCLRPRITQESDASNILTGAPGSPGKTRGRTCVVRSEEELTKFEEGQILVAPYTTPAWTSILVLASGVITETGGALAHAAIIAREYGIPAVVGVSNALERISDDQYIALDGTAGKVYLLPNQQNVEEL